MKFYLMTDMEGVAGVFHWENRDDQSLNNHELRIRIRKYLTEEVNAAVAGLNVGGCDDIIVNDGHGTGASIDLSLADQRARYYHGSERPFWLPFLDASCDATGVLGCHAKAGTEGASLCHTMNLDIRDWSFNGVSVGEAGIQAFIAGHYGVPFVLCAGDVWACREIEALIPGCVTVPVKCGTSRLSVLTVAPAKARDMIRGGAERAMAMIGKIEPLQLKPPVVFREQTVRASFDHENPPPFSRVIDAHTREIEGDDIIDVMCKVYPKHYHCDWRPPEWIFK